MNVATSNRVVARNSLGRFIADCEQAGRDTAKQLVEDGADLSRDLAPRGSERDPRTIPLHKSIKSKMLSATSGIWEATARHALPVEFGSAAHEQTGQVSFLWANAGRWWVPGENMIRHPGAAAQPYLRPAYEAIMQRALRVAAAKYPG